MQIIAKTQIAHYHLRNSGFIKDTVSEWLTDCWCWVIILRTGLELEANVLISHTKLFPVSRWRRAI